MTQVIRISLYGEVDVASDIQAACDVREAAGLVLRGCFESGGDLFMIFQGILNEPLKQKSPSG